VVLPSDPVARASLTRELAALDGARLALSDGDARGAMAQLEAYQRNFPRGRLALEAEVLRIDALAKIGRATEARQHAQTFVRLHPNSVLATRVRAHLD
jgi:outer membrane protein assembly factor BamD (BamD/ComL family)